jgi:hypothetical protein
VWARAAQAALTQLPKHPNRLKFSLTRQGELWQTYLDQSKLRCGTKFMADSTISLDLGFITVDLRNQINNSRNLIETIRNLQATARRIENNDNLRAEIDNQIKAFLKIAGDMSANIELTTANSTSTVTPASIASRSRR